MSVLYWHKTGPRMSYDALHMLRMDDLNPQVSLKWHMRRGEMIKLGFKMIWAGIVGR